MSASKAGDHRPAPLIYGDLVAALRDDRPDAACAQQDAGGRMRVRLSAISTCGRHRGQIPVGTAIASMTGINCGLSPPALR